MMNPGLTYAQEKSGQKLHLVPLMGNGNVLDIALCGKHVERWRMTINVPLAHACKNCMRVNRRRGYARALELILAELQAAAAALKGQTE